MCLKSGLRNRVEKGGGLYWPSKLPLELYVSKEDQEDYK